MSHTRMRPAGARLVKVIPLRQHYVFLVSCDCGLVDEVPWSYRDGMNSTVYCPNCNRRYTRIGTKLYELYEDGSDENSRNVVLKFGATDET